MSEEAQNVKPAQDANTPPNVIANAARFNRQFLDSQLGGNPATVSIGKLLTVMGEQDNTIRELSRILGRNYNEQHLHDMHNSLFGNITSGPSSGREGMHLGNVLTQLTTFIQQQNHQIQILIDEIRKTVEQINDQTRSQYRIHDVTYHIRKKTELFVSTPSSTSGSTSIIVTSGGAMHLVLCIQPLTEYVLPPDW